MAHAQDWILKEWPYRHAQQNISLFVDPDRSMLDTRSKGPDPQGSTVLGLTDDPWDIRLGYVPGYRMIQ